MASSTGVYLHDLLPIPDTDAIANPNKEEHTHALGENATDSHALAQVEQDEKGHAQLDHDNEVQDLGWNEPKNKIAAPLVGGMDNEELWMLVRRFNKVCSAPMQPRLLR